MYGTTKLSKREQIRLIKAISHSLAYKLDNISWTKYYTDYLKDNIQEERNHNIFKPDDIGRGLTISEAGILFAVKQIIEYFVDLNNIPPLIHYISYRKTAFTAYSLVHTYYNEVKEALSKYDYMEVLKMDYCDLIQHDNNGNKLY